MPKKLKIGLIMQGGRGWIGGSEYIRNIILALTSLPPNDREIFEISLMVNSTTDEYFIESVRHYLKDVIVVEEMLQRTILNRAKWAFKRYLLRVPEYRYDSIVEKYKFNFVFPVTSPYLGLNPAGSVTWIPDFQHKYLKEYFTEQDIADRDEVCTKMSALASTVVLSSKSAEDDFKTFYPYASAKTEVLQFKTIANDEWYDVNPIEIQKKYYLPDKFFIISNQFWQHKNHLVVFNAMRLMKDAGIISNVVCTGHIYDHRRPEFSDAILQTIHKLGLSQQVYLLGLIPKTDQIQLLRRSIALIQPSLFEGWSSVVEDARCLGKSLILSDLSVHVEQNPPKSRFFKRSLPESLAEVMSDYWLSLESGPDFQQETIARETNRKEILTFAETFLAIGKAKACVD